MLPIGEETAPLSGDARATGFTLIELLVVLGILALVFAMAVPMLQNARGGAELHAAARDVAGGLREARSRAIASAQPEAFVVDIKNNAFRIGAADKWHRLPVAIRPTLFTPADEQLAEEIGDIRFFPDGSSTGGGVHLAARNAGYEVLVDWLTGRVDIRADPVVGGSGVLAH